MPPIIRKAINFAPVWRFALILLSEKWLGRRFCYGLVSQLVRLVASKRRRVELGKKLSQLPQWELVPYRFKVQWFDQATNDTVIRVELPKEP